MIRKTRCMIWWMYLVTFLSCFVCNRTKFDTYLYCWIDCYYKFVMYNGRRCVLIELWVSIMEQVSMPFNVTFLSKILYKENLTMLMRLYYHVFHSTKFLWRNTLSLWTYIQFYQTNIFLNVTFLSISSLNDMLTLSINILLCIYHKITGPSNSKTMISLLWLHSPFLSRV